MKIVTAEEMRRMDQLTIQRGLVAGEELMRRAGEGAGKIIFKLWRSQSGRVWILCGPGNNGGDGAVVASFLRRKKIPVTLLYLQPPHKMRGEAAAFLAAALRHGIDSQCLPDVAACQAYLKSQRHRPEIIVDALFGTGMSRTLEGPAKALVAWANRQSCLRIAIDVPSGLSAVAKSRVIFRADHTITLQFSKLAMHLYPGCEYIGRLWVVDLGMPRSVLCEVGIRNFQTAERNVRSLCKPPAKDRHKGSVGRLLVIGGSQGYLGAPLMAGYAALKTQGGLVTVVLPEGVSHRVQKNFLELIYQFLPDDGRGLLLARHEDDIGKLARNQDAVVLGPGLGRHPESLALVRNLAVRLPQPLLIDADALRAFPPSCNILSRRRHPTVITPHEGEMGFLMGQAASAIHKQRVECARRYATEQGVHVVLKGYRSLIATPQGEVWINPTGNPGMASAGMGDVLSGVIGSLLMNHPFFKAVLGGVYFHGLAGDDIARTQGERGILAMAVARQIPRTLHHPARQP